MLSQSNRASCLVNDLQDKISERGIKKILTELNSSLKQPGLASTHPDGHSKGGKVVVGTVGASVGGGVVVGGGPRSALALIQSMK